MELKQTAMSHIEEASPDESVVAVAARVLASRLGAVVHALPLAARHADEDAEFVHELRVASRRAVAAIEVFSDLAPGRRARRLIKVLERIRHAAGKARDTDVLLARWRGDEDASASIQRHIARGRRRAQKQLIAIDARFLRTGLLSRRIAKLVDRVASRGRDGGAERIPRFGPWAAGVLSPRVAAFFAASSESSVSVLALHRFRISGKELRYAIEVLAGAFPIELARDLYPVIESSQGKTGEITDHTVACQRLEGRLDRFAPRGKIAGLLRLLRSEEARLGRATLAFASWWTTNRSEELHRNLLELLPPG